MTLRTEPVYECDLCKQIISKEVKIERYKVLLKNVEAKEYHFCSEQHLHFFIVGYEQHANDIGRTEGN